MANPIATQAQARFEKVNPNAAVKRAFSDYAVEEVV